jgi:hypothetical protein
MSKESSLAKPIEFQFLSGPDIGESLRSRQSDDMPDAARTLWALTRKGAIGRRFHWISANGTSRSYQVIAKRETPNEIIITCEHLEDK